MLREGILPPADGEETEISLVPPNHAPSGINCPWHCSGVPSPCGLCSHSSRRLSGARTQSQARSQQSRAVWGVSALRVRGPGTSNGRESHSERVHLCMCLSRILVFFLSSSSGPLATFNLSFFQKGNAEEGNP